MEIKILLSKIRAERRISLEKLSEMSGLSKTYINDIENGKRNPTLTSLCQIAKALDVGLDDMIRF